MDEGLLKQKRRLIKSGRTAVDELIKVAESIVIESESPTTDGEETAATTQLAADKMKNAAAAKKLAIFDAFEILEKLELEEQRIQDSLENTGDEKNDGSFAEKFAGK